MSTARRARLRIVGSLLLLALAGCADATKPDGPPIIFRKTISAEIMRTFCPRSDASVVAREFGTVQLRIVTSATDHAEMRVDLIESSGFPRLDETAIACTAKYKTQVARGVDGKAAEIWSYENFVFADDGPAALDAASIRGGIQRCWVFNTDIPAAIVRLRVTVDGSGHYSSAEILDRLLYERDPKFRLAADAAKRSVLDPRCNKLPLPPDRLALLPPSFILNFRPTEPPR